MPDAKEVTDIMLDIERAPKEADDPITSLLQQAWARMANCLKEVRVVSLLWRHLVTLAAQDFAPFLEVILPPLLHDAALDPHVTILPRSCLRLSGSLWIASLFQLFMNLTVP